MIASFQKEMLKAKGGGQKFSTSFVLGKFFYLFRFVFTLTLAKKVKVIITEGLYYIIPRKGLTHTQEQEKVSAAESGV